MSDTPTLVTVAIGAIALGASSLRLAQYALRKNAHPDSNGNSKTVGKLNVDALERMLEEAARLNTTNTILPILDRLTKVAEKQVDAMQSNNLILVELKTIIRERRAPD